MICKYFLLFCWLSFTFLIVSFEAQKFNFGEIQFPYYFFFAACVFGVTVKKLLPKFKIIKIYIYAFF